MAGRTTAFADGVMHALYADSTMTRTHGPSALMPLSEERARIRERLLRERIRANDLYVDIIARHR